MRITIQAEERDGTIIVKCLNKDNVDGNFLTSCFTSEQNISMHNWLSVVFRHSGKRFHLQWEFEKAAYSELQPEIEKTLIQLQTYINDYESSLQPKQIADHLMLVVSMIAQNKQSNNKQGE